MPTIKPRSAFQSTPPVKAATECFGVLDTPTPISIHAAREGGDATGKYRLPAVYGFQSTPPVKAATLARYIRDAPRMHFNPRRP